MNDKVAISLVWKKSDSIYASKMAEEIQDLGKFGKNSTDSWSKQVSAIQFRNIAKFHSVVS